MSSWSPPIPVDLYGVADAERQHRLLEGLCGLLGQLGLRQGPPPLWAEGLAAFTAPATLASGMACAASVQTGQVQGRQALGAGGQNRPQFDPLGLLDVFQKAWPDLPDLRRRGPSVAGGPPLGLRRLAQARQLTSSLSSFSTPPM